MEQVLDLQHRIQCVQNALAKRPWVPWLLPVLFILGYRAVHHALLDRDRWRRASIDPWLRGWWDWGRCYHVTWNVS